MGVKFNFCDLVFESINNSNEFVSIMTHENESYSEKLEHQFELRYDN